jgi:hypothetical protein
LHDPPGFPGFHAVASLAQLVERLTRNEKVASSILAGSSQKNPVFPLIQRGYGVFCWLRRDGRKGPGHTYGTL